MLHSSAYRNGEPWRGRRVLVVGFGSSAGEIAIDLHEPGAIPTLAVRSAVNVIPRELAGISIVLIGSVLSVLPPVADALGALHWSGRRSGTSAGWACASSGTVRSSRPTRTGTSR